MNGDATQKELWERIHELDIEVRVYKEQLEGHEKYTEKALLLGYTELRERLEGMNNFRDQLEEQTKHFITFDLYNANYKSLEAKIEAMQKIVWGGLAIVSFLVFAIPLLMHFLDKK